MGTGSEKANADPELVSVGALEKKARAVDVREFVAAHAAPALLLSALTKGTKEDASAEANLRERSYRRTLLAGGANGTPSQGANSASLRYDGRVAFLTKKPGNLFPNMISIGRAMNSDVVLVIETVSKFHGYFQRDDERWSVTDHRSTNGIQVNGKRLARGETRALADGDRITLGTDLEAEFVLPATLYERLTRTGA
jgi:hypothetical protein